MLDKITYEGQKEPYIREHIKWFTGKGITYRLICSDCARLPVNQIEAATPVCKDCFRQLEQEGGCDGKIGEPAFLESQVQLEFEVSTSRRYDMWTHSIADIQPLYHAPLDNWLVLTSKGELFRVPAISGAKIELLTCLRGHVDFAKPVLMRLSPDERYAAIANTFGQTGMVVDLATNAVTHEFSRDTYHTEHCIFPIAFFEAEEKTYLVCGTKWNRLDIIDPADGRLVTPREYESVPKGTRPPHYLDFFHGLLTVSPENDLVIDNGWVWHPVGAPVAFSLKHWLSNVWESEDGPSRKYLDFRDYSWPTPVCWIDHQIAALSGFGRDDLWIIPAAQLVNAQTGKTLRWFAGPKGEFFFDEYLFASSEDGLTAWNIDSGERVVHQPSFHPRTYHRRTKEFLSILPDNRFRVGRVVPQRKDSTSGEVKK